MTARMALATVAACVTGAVMSFGLMLVLVRAADQLDVKELS